MNTELKYQKKREGAYRRILDRSKTNFVFSRSGGEISFVNPKLPLIIMPFDKFCLIDVFYNTNSSVEDFEQMAEGLRNVMDVRQSLERKGYRSETGRLRRDNHDLVYQFYAETPTGKDLERVLRDCNSL